MNKSKKFGMAGLGVGALGIVYGDIGTSPLYAANQIFFGHTGVSYNSQSIIGVISLILWTLVIVIAVKYMSLVLRADNAGEGGVFAFFGQLHQHAGKRSTKIMLVLLILAAGFLYGDGLITPAISVLSATEGLQVVNASFASYVLPATLVILTLLFAFQHKGTARVGSVFGPVMLLWFSVIAGLGLVQIVKNPSVLEAINPLKAVDFIRHSELHKTFLIFGSIVLVVTGGEAVFADVGHFGKAPIRLGWFYVVMPALLLNYMGQGALLLSGQPVLGGSIFYSMVPSGLLLPMVILATLATIIASQALISGAFSLTSQAIALDLLPKLRKNYTNLKREGQVYLNFVNWTLYLGCVLIVLAFRTSGALASAYGLAVSFDMVVTSLAMIFVVRQIWRWNLPKTLLVWLPLLAIDLLFLSANSLKFRSGGYIPLAIGVTLFFLMITWQWGRRKVLSGYMADRQQTVGDFIKLQVQSNEMFPKPVLVLTGTLVNQSSDLVPAQLQLFYDEFKALPKRLVVLTVSTLHTPKINKNDRFRYTWFRSEAEQEFLSIQARFGYMERVSVPQILEQISQFGDLEILGNLDSWVVLAGRDRLSLGSGVTSWWYRLRYGVFKFMNHTTLPTYEFYGLSEDLRLVVQNIPVRFN